MAMSWADALLPGPAAVALVPAALVLGAFVLPACGTRTPEAPAPGVWPLDSAHAAQEARAAYCVAEAARPECRVRAYRQTATLHAFIMSLDMSPGEPRNDGSSAVIEVWKDARAGKVALEIHYGDSTFAHLPPD